MSNRSTQIKLLVLLFLLSGVVEAQKPSDSSSGVGDDAWGENSNVGPSMAIVVIVLVLGFFITGCIYIYIQHCTDASSSTVTANRGINNNNNKVVRGLDQSVIDSFPVFQYSSVKELKIGKGALECAVCLSEFDDDETLRLLPKCDHVFHSDCIDAWLVDHSTCPVCRDNLVYVPDSDNKLGHSAESDSASIPNSEVQIAIPGDEQTTSLPNKKGRFPRSHSTGHSLSQPGEDIERFTLRLPAEVRRQIIGRNMMKRATSLVALPRQSSSRRGYRSGGGGEGSGSSRYGRFFGRSFIMRVASFRSTAKVQVHGDLTAKEVETTMDQSFTPLPV